MHQRRETRYALLEGVRPSAGPFTLAGLPDGVYTIGGWVPPSQLESRDGVRTGTTGLVLKLKKP